MSLDLSPEVESQVLARARAAGTSASEYIARLLRNSPLPVEAPTMDPVLDFLRSQLAEAQEATPEETLQAEAEWRQFKQAINETRSSSGESPIFVSNALR